MLMGENETGNGDDVIDKVGASAEGLRHGKNAWLSEARPDLTPSNRQERLI